MWAESIWHLACYKQNILFLKHIFPSTLYLQRIIIICPFFFLCLINKNQLIGFRWIFYLRFNIISKVLFMIFQELFHRREKNYLYFDLYCDKFFTYNCIVHICFMLLCKDISRTTWKWLQLFFNFKMSLLFVTQPTFFCATNRTFFH